MLPLDLRLLHRVHRHTPLGFGPAISVVRNWTYSLFYFLANMWGSVVVSLLFWGFANEVTTIDEAKRYYPLFGMGANVALVFSGHPHPHPIPSQHHTLSSPAAG